MDINQLQKRYGTIQSRLDEIDQKSKTTAPAVQGFVENFSGMPAGYSPQQVVQDIGSASQFRESRRDARNAVSTEGDSLLQMMNTLKQQEADNAYRNKALSLQEAEAGATFNPATGKYDISAGANSAEKAKLEGELRKEFETRTKELGTREVQSAYQKIKNTTDNGAGDISLIVAYMKMLDPTSAVREAEFNTAQDAGSYLQKTYGKAVKFTRGDRLDATVRQQFKSEAGQIYNQFVERQMAQNLFYDRLALAQGLDHRKVTGGVGRLQKEKLAQPKKQTKGGFNIGSMFGLNTGSPIGIQAPQQQAQQPPTSNPMDIVNKYW